MKDIITAPPVAICAVCCCLCSNELVTVSYEYDHMARRELPVFRHVSASACAAAVKRSEAFWTGKRAIERAA